MRMLPEQPIVQRLVQQMIPVPRVLQTRVPQVRKVPPVLLVPQVVVVAKVEE